MLKVNIGYALDIMKKILEIGNRNYNLRHEFLIKKSRLVYYVTETASFIEQKYGTLYVIAAKTQPHFSNRKFQRES